MIPISGQIMEISLKMTTNKMQQHDHQENLHFKYFIGLTASLLNCSSRFSKVHQML